MQLLINTILCRYANSLVPLSDWEGNTFFYIDASCRRAGRSMCPIRGWAVTNLTLNLIIISFALAHHSSSPAMFALSTNLPYLLRFC